MMYDAEFCWKFYSWLKRLIWLRPRFDNLWGGKDFGEEIIFNLKNEKWKQMK